MIRAEELRKGVLVKDKLGRILKVSGFKDEYTYGTKDEYVYLELSNGNKLKYLIESISPIELTEEILVEWCGATKSESKIFQNIYTINLKRNICLVISDVGNPNFMIGLAQFDYENSSKIDDLVTIWNWDYEKNISLHQLQNLCYDLGQELPMNIKTN